MAIDHISDTARWVAVYRAMESERSDALFHDPYARRLAGTRGEAIASRIGRRRAGAAAMAVRTAVFDEIICDTVARHGVDLVVNLAAGLDTRAWRLPLPSTLRWVDVDLPEILAYKTNALRSEKTTCVYEAVSADLTSAAIRVALFTRLGATASTALVVTEGLLIYLPAPQVEALGRDLHAIPTFRWWLIDLVGPRMLAMMNRAFGDQLARGNAQFVFGPPEGTKFFEPFGWREVVLRSGLEEGRRLGREMRNMWFWRLVTRLSPSDRREQFYRLTSFALLERI
jgi:methyltransferase (TIGR00027 family)